MRKRDVVNVMTVIYLLLITAVMLLGIISQQLLP